MNFLGDLDLADDIMNLGRIRHLPVADGKTVGVWSVDETCFGLHWLRPWDTGEKRKELLK
jgi:hypothetical protein